MKINKNIITFICISLIYVSTSAYAEVEYKSNIILYSQWYLRGPQNNDGNTYTKCPLYHSLVWRVNLNKWMEVLGEYSFIPVNILSQEYFKIEYERKDYWLRQGLEFVDNRIKLGIGVVLLNRVASGRIVNRFGLGGSFNSIINERYSIRVTPEVTGFPAGTSDNGPPLSGSLKRFYPQGYCWIVSNEILWKKSLKGRIDLLLGCKYEYALYDDKDKFPAYLNNFKAVEIVSNKLISISLGVSYRFK